MTDIGAALAEAHRRDWAQVLATTVRVTRDLDLAEECTQEAYAQALRTWPSSGVPDRPGAWLTQVARHRALDVMRREAALRRRLPQLVLDAPAAPGPLQLIFTCCHPALSRDAQVALTARLVCGLSTAEIARAFLVPEPTMAARLTRAKKKIATARIPYRVPADDQLAERLGPVLDVIHLLFTTGHTAPAGPSLIRHDLVTGAIDLARTLRLLMPRTPEVGALLALLLLTDARTPARIAPDGRMLLLAEQDRTLWDRGRIAEGTALLTDALRRHPPTRYAVEAAIAAVHAEAPAWADTDWTEIVGLYDVLVRLCPDSPVVALNRAVALGFRDGPAAGLAATEPLLSMPSLATYPYLSAARAAFLRRLGRRAEAEAAYQEALALTGNEVERGFLSQQTGKPADSWGTNNWRGNDRRA
ncbi:RNA polymerase sigma factor [Actinoplanes sp. CA-131856]